MDDQQPIITVTDLPMTFQVKYLGSRPARGLWGIKHTRKPVDALVAAAKDLAPGQILPFVKVEVSTDGLSFKPIGDKKKDPKSTTVTNMFKVDTISYGVQDLIYSRVFSMIIVKEEDLKDGLPFVCHGFACESRNQARQLTYALAAAFQFYGKKVKEENADNPKAMKKRFAIDLRTPEELQSEEMEDETEA